MADRVIPNSLNYADIKPEAVEAEIKLVKFTPTSTVTGAKGGDIVKFLLVGNGFMDPYSTYLQFEVECKDFATNEVRFIDRSAHSFIQRLVIRSQGVEIERIENYDVVAAMVHDMIYSPEQCALHHWEGFPNQQVDMASCFPTSSVATQGIWSGQTTPQACSGQTAGLTGIIEPLRIGHAFRPRALFAQLIGNGASPILTSYLGEMCFSDGIRQECTGISDFSSIYGWPNSHPTELGAEADLGATQQIQDELERKLTFLADGVAVGADLPAKRVRWAAVLPVIKTYLTTGQYTGALTTNILNRYLEGARQFRFTKQNAVLNDRSYPLDIDLFRDFTFAADRDKFGTTTDLPLDGYDVLRSVTNQSVATQRWMNGLTPHSEVVPLQYAGHVDGKRVACVAPVDLASNVFSIPAVRKMQFQIPIYSGLIGVMQPDKKLIPINLLPLDIEITFNPHALYSSDANGSRAYTITKFHMYSHMIFFEQEIHRSLEAAVAEHGIFLYCNQFHLAPVSLLSNTTLPSFAYISMNLKSINSIHALFYYNAFETSPCARKLHFVSHRIRKLQILNGTTLIPQEPIVGQAGSSLDYAHTPFIIELYKAWNKLHDPRTDGALEAFNYCGDQYGKQFDPTPILLNHPNTVLESIALLVNKQGHVGRCQYGISLEGEDLGTDKTMVTGRKSQYPFLLYMEGEKLSNRTSYMNVFLRADFIVYIRPDLQVVTLGK